MSADAHQRTIRSTRRRIGVGLLMAVAFTLIGIARAEEAVTVKGEVLDLSCYLAEGEKGPEHKSCAVMCAQRGLPLGVLAESGDVYLLASDHEKAEAYDAVKKLAGSNAEITGRKVSKGGMTAIVVHAAKGL